MCSIFVMRQKLLLNENPLATAIYWLSTHPSANDIYEIYEPAQPSYTLARQTSLEQVHVYI